MIFFPFTDEEREAYGDLLIFPQIIPLLTERFSFKVNVFYSTQCSFRKIMPPENQRVLWSTACALTKYLVKRTQHRAGARHGASHFK